MIRFPEPRVSFDRITDLVYLGSRIASLDDYHRLKAQGVRACVDMKQEGADPWTFDAFLWLPTVDHEPPSPMHLCIGLGGSWSTVGSHRKASNVQGSAPSCFMSTQARTPCAFRRW